MTAKPSKVLIVDDSRAILAIVRRCLESAAGGSSLNVRTATGGQEALDIIPEFQPDLVITDWHMPGVSGIEMLQTLRQTGFDKVQVGFVTAETTPDRVAEAHSNGAAFVVHKPFHDGELLEALRLALQSIEGAVAGRPQGEQPLQAEAVERLLRVALKQIPFALKACEPLRPADLTPFLLRCQYAQGTDDTPKVLGLLDFPALCLVGAGSGASSVDAAVAANEKGRPDPEVVQRANTFMRVAAKLIKGHSDAQPWRLLKSQVVSRGVGELDELLTSATSRLDMRLSATGCADGRVSFFRTEP